MDDSSANEAGRTGANEAGRTVQSARTTFRVLETVRERERVGVTELATTLDMSKSAVHRHLATLVAENRVEKAGQKYVADVDRRNTEGASMTFAIVETLKRLGGATVGEVAEELDSPETTVEHYLSWLLDEEYVTLVGDRYSAGLKFLDIGETVKYGIDNFDVAAEQVDRLASESGELALFSVLEHGQNVLLYKSHGDDSIQTAHEIGLREPLHCSALGKAILSELPTARVESIVDRHGLTSFTEHTITDREELFAELARTRKRGYAIDDEEAKPGIRCIAAPIVTQEQERYSAVSVTAPTSRMQGERFEEELPELVTGAANVVEVNSIYV